MEFHRSHCRERIDREELISGAVRCVDGATKKSLDRHKRSTPGYPDNSASLVNTWQIRLLTLLLYVLTLHIVMLYIFIAK